MNAAIAGSCCFLPKTSAAEILTCFPIVCRVSHKKRLQFLLMTGCQLYQATLISQVCFIYFSSLLLVTCIFVTYGKVTFHLVYYNKIWTRVDVSRCFVFKSVLKNLFVLRKKNNKNKKTQEKIQVVKLIWLIYERTFF